MAKTKHLARLFSAVAAGDLATARVLATEIADAEELAGRPRAAETLRQALTTTTGPIPDPLMVRGPVGAGSVFPLRPSSLGRVRLRADAKSTLREVVREYKNRDRLAEHGLQPRNRLFFHGPPGCGKTLTARALAGELRLPIHVVRFDSLLGSLLGETARRLAEVMELARLQPSVLLLDEVDAIARRRGNASDVAELDRVVIALMQLLDLSRPAGIIVAASNLPEDLDPALMRRFDLSMEFPAPDRRMLMRFATRIAQERGVPLLNGVAAALRSARSFDDAERVVIEEQRSLILRDL